MTDSEKLEAIREIANRGGDAHWNMHEILKVLRDEKPNVFETQVDFE